MRKLGLISTLWTGILFFPLTSFALGLGEIEASSFLNQPLKAEIEVFSARAGEIDDLLISLASRDAFEKAGLERPAGLSKLRFKVEKSEDGSTARILVSTKAPVVEPFLSFLIEADWAKGRLLREFTVLLDPLTFAQQAVKVKVIPEPAEVKQPEPIVTQAEVTEAVVEEVQPQPQAVEQSLPDVSQPIAAPIATPVAASPVEEPAPYVADNQYVEPVVSVDQVVVAKGDTLWAIASQFKDENHSMAQVMLAMQMMNPDAFSKDNINNLKVGAVLRVPDMDVMDRLTKQEAYAQVLEQNGLWDEYVARKSGATSNAIADSSDAIESSQEEEAGNQLSLLTADDGDSDSASLQNDANSENAGQIRKQLALAEEELEAARLENDDLKSRIEMLEEQQSKYDELQKLVQIEDNSLAQLQQNTEEDVVAIEVGTTVTGDMTETVEEASDSMLEEEELATEE
ncbi:MAG: LysM peptidoglycan-binding domain-containing protein, partial [Gammaproteobacteria bacterium]|nr:LysM peptidoglycan-binding domain-containing protein [Gammaproteobacteria bacterium]